MNSAGPAWSAARYAANARFVSDLGAAALDLLAARPGERILDLGCGDGALTARIAEGGAEVLGVDASPDMVAAARRRGVDALVGRVDALDAGAGFDAVFSKAALHWMTEPDAVIARAAALAAPALRDRSGAWTADYVPLRFRAVLGRAA